MIQPRHLLLLSCFALTLTPSWASDPWVAFTVAETHEVQALSLLDAQNVRGLSWSNALVEVSAFEGLELVPVAHLDRRLTPQDPRWDPWLRAIGSSYAPRSGTVRVWVASQDAAQARTALADLLVNSAKAASRPVDSPASITGWTLIASAVLTLALLVVAGVLGGWPAWNEPRRWVWFPVAALVLLAGIVLVRPGSAAPAQAGSPSISWLQHRWFQEAWPWGARWDDYAPDRAWSFRNYEHKEGKLTEVEATLSAADRTWAEAALEGLDPHHAQQIFGTGNP